MAKFSFKEKLQKFFGVQSNFDDDFFDDMADVLIESDIGAKLAFELIEKLEKKCKELKLKETSQVQSLLKDLLNEYVLETTLTPERNKINVYLVLGVNGVGKTTSVAKMANFYKKEFSDSQNFVTIAAADTFRAAAIDQLKYHGEKVGVRVVAHKDGADPSAVVFDAVESAKSKGEGLVLVDTAGRLHNKENLVRELQKIDRTARQKTSEGCYKKILVLDATTGQNALRQAEVFHEAVGIDAVILTKYDSTAKGGMIATLGRDLKLPVAFDCFGETYPDIEIFNKEKFLSDLLGN